MTKESEKKKRKNDRAGVDLSRAARLSARSAASGQQDTNKFVMTALGAIVLGFGGVIAFDHDVVDMGTIQNNVASAADRLSTQSTALFAQNDVVVSQTPVVQSAAVAAEPDPAPEVEVALADDTLDLSSIPAVAPLQSEQVDDVELIFASTLPDLATLQPAPVETVSPIAGELAKLSGATGSACTDTIQRTLSQMLTATAAIEPSQDTPGIQDLMQQTIDCRVASLEIVGSLELLEAGLAEVQLEWDIVSQNLTVGLTDTFAVTPASVVEETDANLVSFVLQ